MNSNEYLRPPGTYFDILSHPSGIDRAIEVAVVQDHRFAFYYWSKWYTKFGNDAPPTLISLDWHQDLAFPSETEQNWLRELDTSDYKSVAHFCWDRLHGNNDGQILAAAYLNLIGDIHVVQKQDEESVDQFFDMEGRRHTVQCFTDVNDLLKAVSNQNQTPVILDIDLDYFTESLDSCGDGDSVDLVSTETIQECLDPRGDFMAWIFRHMCGMTIATEPEFCGGLLNSNRLLDTVNETLFSPSLLSHRAGWRHLS